MVAACCLQVRNTIIIGAIENAGLENAAPSKMQGWKIQDQPGMESQPTHDVYLLI